MTDVCTLYSIVCLASVILCNLSLIIKPLLVFLFYLMSILACKHTIYCLFIYVYHRRALVSQLQMKQADNEKLVRPGFSMYVLSA